ncbi:hypothetical protein PMPD1_1344 [Paramixta manurensis]|uniref:CdiI immunity protein domain-containing protein n=1 Tax=Paramixta manurensis TaxID=2740817 RepID=A0A6M8ULK9_9GAMM|nr:hypothetical protein PMPD1_1344 [Erwiniaceae bacterium PD-1]
MLITGEIDIMIGGTLNQDFDFITGADTMDGAIRVYVSELNEKDRGTLKREITHFLSLSDEEITKEFRERYPNEFAPEDGKGLLEEVLKAIAENK